MSLQDNAANVAFASKYAVDKVVAVKRGSYAGTDTTTIAGYLYRHAIPHSFTRPLFTELLWSFDGTNYEDGGGVVGASGISFADSNNLYIMTTSPPDTVYYKLIGSWINEFDTTDPLITPDLNTTDTAYFDSRANYQKIFMEGATSGSAIATSTTITVDHNLGYTPNVKVMFESLPGQVWPQFSGGVGATWLYDPATQYTCSTIITSTQLLITIEGGISSAATCRCWYRIYLDD